MNKHTPEERKAMKVFLADVETQLNRSQSLHSLNMAYGKPHGVTESAWQNDIDAAGRHLEQQWQMIRDLRKEYNIK